MLSGRERSFGIAAAGCISVVSGVVAAKLVAISPVSILIGAICLTPLASQVRHTGFRRAIEPSPMTVILAFYLLVFPLRAVVIAANHGRDVFLAQDPVPSSLQVQVLIGASVATALTLEAYYFVTRGSADRRWVPDHYRQMCLAHAGRRETSRLVRFTFLLEGITLLALLQEIHREGFGGAQKAFSTHSKAAALASSASSAGSVWQILAAPAIWAAAAVLSRPGVKRRTRVLVGGASVVILLAQLVIYGSRLNVILSLMGAWVVLYHSGWRIPLRALLVGLVALIAVSFPLIAERNGGRRTTQLSTVESLSRIVGYDIFDTALAIHQRPTVLRQDLEQTSRWLDVEEYLVPGFLWAGRPNIQGVRIDLYTAQALGTQNDVATGFPASYMTELWLYGGWLGVAVGAIGFGAGLGMLMRRVWGTGDGGPSVTSMLIGAFCVQAAFSYYKGGDILVTFVGVFRSVVYLGVLLWIGGLTRVSAASEASSEQCRTGQPSSRARISPGSHVNP